MAQPGRAATNALMPLVGLDRRASRLRLNPQSKIPKKVPTRTWRELIKKAWDVDPMLCPKCGGQMRLISLIEEDEIIEKILRHLDLWEGTVRCTDRGPPLQLEPEYIREPFYDDLPFGPDSYAE